MRRPDTRRWRRTLAAAALAAAVALSGCGLPIPADPEGTLERVEAGTLRAGVSPTGSLVMLDDGKVSGPLPDLVEGFAREHGARVTWTIGSEEDLVDRLADGDLDLAIGGMTVQTPWADRASVTRGYPGIAGSKGAEVALLLPLGENAFQSALERYLDREVGP